MIPRENRLPQVRVYELSRNVSRIRIGRGRFPEFAFLAGLVVGASSSIVALFDLIITLSQGAMPATVVAVFTVFILLLSSILFAATWNLMQCVFERSLTVDRERANVVLHNVPLCDVVVPLREIECVFGSISHHRSAFLGDVCLKREGVKRPLAVLGVRAISSQFQDEVIQRIETVVDTVAHTLDKPKHRWRYVKWYQKTFW